MKKLIPFFTLMLFTFLAKSQSNYDRGFKEGYKAGYCYNESPCMVGSVVVDPPNPSESYNSYQDGYNHGFTKGSNENQNRGGNSSGMRYGGRLNSPQSIVNYNNIDPNLMIQVQKENRSRTDYNIDYRDKLISWIFDLKSKTNDRMFLDAMDHYYNQLRSLDNYPIGQMGNIIDGIKQDIKAEIDKYNTRLNEISQQNENRVVNDLRNTLQKFKEEGIKCYKNGNYSLAELYLSKFIEANVDIDPEVISIRGWSKYYLKDYSGALVEFNRELEFEPFSPIAYYNRGSAKSLLKDEIGAISDYTKAIALKPDFSMAYNNRGWSKFELKKYLDALIDLNKAIELDPTNWIAYDSRQEIKFAMNNYKGCIDDCNKAIDLNGQSSNSYFIRGRANYRLGNKEEACADWNKANELGKSETNDYINKYCKNSNKANNQLDNNNDYILDNRDGKKYKIVKIQNQVWMAENLAFKPNKGNYWAYNNDIRNVQTYGYLYDWTIAMTVCPLGWHIPTKEDWVELNNYLGKNAGLKLKAQIIWSDIDRESNSSGFTGLPGGIVYNSTEFESIEKRGSWWSATKESNGIFILSYNLYNNSSTLDNTQNSKDCGMSIRCVKE